MKKYYYGAWNSFYNLSWPVRFGVELIFFLIFLYIVIKLLKKIGNLLRLKIYLIKGCVWLVTEIVYLVGHNNEWAVTIDGKITDWGNKMLNNTWRKKHYFLKSFIALGREPSLNAEIIGGVTGQTEIIYKNQWENDGERYWVKVCIPDDGIEGWLSGKLVDGEQLELILSNLN